MVDKKGLTLISIYCFKVSFSYLILEVLELLSALPTCTKEEIFVCFLSFGNFFSLYNLQAKLGKYFNGDMASL